MMKYLLRVKDLLHRKRLSIWFKKPVQARLNIEQLKKLVQKTGIPLVLHGGSGVQKEYVLQAIQNGITKINVGTEIRQTYEKAYKESGNNIQAAQKALKEKTKEI